MSTEPHPRGRWTPTARARAAATVTALLATALAGDGAPGVFAASGTPDPTGEPATGVVLNPIRTAALEAWRAQPDAVLVILVLDGLRLDALDARGPDQTPLMPRLNSLLDRALLFEDCLTGSPEPALGLYHLLTGRRALQALRGEPNEGQTGLATLARSGFRRRGLCFRADVREDPLLRRAFPWSTPEPSSTEQSADAGGPLDSWPAATQIRAMGRMLETALAEDAPALLVWVTDLLLPPFQLPDRWLSAYDPTPWAGAERVVRMEDLRRNRLARVRRMATLDADAVRRSQSAKETAEPAWLSNTAHAFADSLLGDLLATLRVPEAARRVSLVITATHGTSHRRTMEGGGPLDPDVCRVPLIWCIPGLASGGRIAAPVVAGDLAATVAHGVDAPSGTADWRDPLPPERERWCFLADLDGTGGVRLTTSRFSYREGEAREPTLFDLRADPGEYENLAGSQTALVQVLRQRARESVCGKEPRLWLVVKPPEGTARIRGILRPERPAAAIESRGLEADDLVQGDREVRFELGGDRGGDAFVVQLASSDPGLTLTLQGPGAAAWPVFVGDERLSSARGTTWRLTFPHATLLRALLPELPDRVDPWIEAHPTGIHLWVVANEADLLIP